MNSIISLSVEEVEANFDFVFSLVEKGHTIKINTDKGAVMMTPVAQLQVAGVDIPATPEEFVPDPAGTSAFVSQSLAEMTQDF
tara:strand:- start:372 stop:620 length:249 start_codon:yes stop_codon:yes gene_type:complete